LKGDKNMKNNTKMTVTYSQYEHDIIIAEEYPDGSVKGEFLIVNTPLGFQLKAYHDSWKIFSRCNELFELLGNQSMSGVITRHLAEMIADIGYELRVI
jgi:hypothetical protein